MENIEKTFQNILLAEQEAQKIVEKAQDEAMQIVNGAIIKADGLRQETLKKLNDEKEINNQIFLEEKTKINDEMQNSSKAQVNALQEKYDKKKEKIA